MEITGLLIYMLAAFSVVCSLWALRNAWNSAREAKRISTIVKDFPKSRWLLKMGMREHAICFNAFGLRGGAWLPLE